jgi:hypothetical protein
MDKAEKYDIKEASNPGLTASARRNYSVNAESNIKGAKMYGKSKGPKMGAKKGDQSKSRADYAMDSGKTDKGYKGKDGSSKGDQSASKRDYMGKGPKMYDKGPKMESMSQEKSNLMNDMPIDSRASKGSPAMNLNKGYGKPMASPMKMAGSWMSKHTKSKM